MNNDSIELKLKSQFPKKEFRIKGKTLSFCRFEAHPNQFKDANDFSFFVLLLMGSPSTTPPNNIAMEFDSIELLLATGLAGSNAEAERLLKKKLIKIGEPKSKRKPLGKKLKLKDAYNALVTLSRADSDWVILAIET